eukprot:TRINITY_DN1233_c0_g1_i1.p1 TRINITY_DN1233_c0_g1~~TRINITY_DN1233_c0_g1_i1.p1  ORF type:complete len:389 (+),score=74.87 TRINITY_DN1233_c0_g1_i1:42-1208(+)
MALRAAICRLKEGKRRALGVLKSSLLLRNETEFGFFQRLGSLPFLRQAHMVSAADIDKETAQMDPFSSGSTRDVRLFPGALPEMTFQERKVSSFASSSEMPEMSIRHATAKLGKHTSFNKLAPEISDAVPWYTYIQRQCSSLRPNDVVVQQMRTAGGGVAAAGKANVQDSNYSVRQLVVTASGPDRPGIVSRLCKRVLECGGNVEESRMARLGGVFTILMLVTMDASLPQKAEELRKQLLGINGLEVNTDGHNLKAKKRNRKFRKISVRGADNPGLVYNVTEYLAGNNINIEDLETSTQEQWKPLTQMQAPFSGSILFAMDGIIAMPLTMSTRELAMHLDTLQQSLAVEIILGNLDPAHKDHDIRNWTMRLSTNGANRYSSRIRILSD